MLFISVVPIATAAGVSLVGRLAALQLRPGRPSLEPIVSLYGKTTLYHELLYRPQWPWNDMPMPSEHNMRWKRWHRYIFAGTLQNLLVEKGAIAINLNSAQATDTQVIKALLRLLRAGGAYKLWIEWTEYPADRLTLLRASNNLEELQEAGAQIAIDDAGAEGTSWERRAMLVPPQMIKLDGPLLHAATREPHARAWNQARDIVQIARSDFHAQIVAEWVETRAHLVTAKQLGCTFGQGIFFTQNPTL